MRELGAELGRALMASPDGPLVIYFQGDLGAGKTTLVGGIVNGLGVRGPVRSPTYTLIEPYDTSPKRIFHLDLYRLATADEVEPLGIRDLLTRDVVLLIEWPEKGGEKLPMVDLQVAIDYSQNTEARDLRIRAMSGAGERLMSALRLSAR